MITTQAIKIAQEIQEAQSKAKIELITKGVLVCIDTAAGLYKFVKYGDLPLDDTTIGAMLKEVYNLSKLNEANVNSLIVELKELRQEYQEFKTKTIEVIKALETKLTDITEENEVL
jgi:hypothetical protein